MRNALSKLGKISVLCAFLVCFLSIPPPSATAQSDEWVEVSRGRNFMYYSKGDLSRHEIFGGPIFTQADNGSWVPYVFEDLGDRYCVQCPYGSVKFFDYYSEIWTEGFENVVIYNDQFRAEYLNKQGNWTDTSFWNIVRSYEIGDDWISIFRTGDTVIGQRVENYTFRQGSPVKITITQTCTSAQIVRFVWKPSGIVATSESVNKDEENRTSHLTYWDENNWVGSLAWFDELEIVENIDVAVDEHAQGRKATITFGNFEVGAGGTAKLDPTETFYSSMRDGHILNLSASYSTAHDATVGGVSSGEQYVQIGQYVSGGTYLIYRGFVFFDTTNLPDDATIIDAMLSLYAHLDKSIDNEFDVVVQNGQPAYPHYPLVSADYNQSYYLDNGGSFNTASFSSGYNDISLDENARENWIRKDNITKLCLRSSSDIDNIAPPGYEYVTVYSSEKGSGFQPKLIITWTTPLPQPYGLKVEGEDSPQRLTTLTPTFSFTYYSENGDNMENFRIQVGTSAGDNSLWDITTAQENENNDNITIAYAGATLSRGIQYFWRVRVQDNNSTWGNFSDNENFQINRPPTCSITAPTSGADFDVDEGMGFASSATDNDGDSLGYHWDFGDLAGASTQANPSYNYSTQGDYTVTLYVDDGYENSATASIILNIGGGTPAPPSDGGGGGGGGGGISIPTPKEIVDEVVEPEKNILFVPLFGIGPLVINPFIGLVVIAVVSKYKKQRGIFLTCVMLLGFLIFFGSRLV